MSEKGSKIEYQIKAFIFHKNKQKSNNIPGRVWETLQPDIKKEKDYFCVKNFKKLYII